MRTFTPLWLLVTLGAVSAGQAALAAEPSQWKCETCPFETGSSGKVDLGVGHVSEDSAKYGDYTGLEEKGAFAIAGGSWRRRGEDGYYTDLVAKDLGLDIRSIDVNGGREGSWAYRLGYSEIPRHFSDGAMTPFLGIGGPVLTLPPGYPADSTASMPLSSTLQAVDIGYKRSRIDLGGTLQGSGGWQFRLDARHDERDGTQRGAGAFFSSTSQLVLPLDQTTDQVEAVAEYADKRLQASLGYHGSTFRNGNDALSWDNPFTPVVSGATTGQLALAPDNEFHEVFGTIGYQFTPTLRASGELSMGRGTQDQGFLASTTNASLGVSPLPAASLDGQVDTLDATLRLTAAPMERLRIAASLIRNERDNKTSSLLYPQVSTDMFVGSARLNLPYSFTRDRAKLEADWRGNGGWKLAGGLEYDSLERTLQETTKTEEGSMWARGSINPAENLSLALKYLHGQRDNNGYAVVPSATPQNPLMRKYNQADRRRNLLEARADWAVVEGSSLGFNVDITDDDYTDSVVGLTGAYSASMGVDLAMTLSENTQLRVYGQTEQIKSALANSQQFAQPDWRGYSKDAFNTIGLGLTHNAMSGKLELGGDLVFSRSRSDTTIQFASFATTAFPTVKTALDSLTLRGIWHQSAKLSLLGSLAYEHYDSKNWQLDGILPGTVPNLLAFGEQAPRYNVGVIRFAVRYGF